jgi:katanin p60 ATPase-containing subunit A1
VPEIVSQFWFFFREIDPAFLRRFERKVLLDLPSDLERSKMIEKHLPISREWPEAVTKEFCVATEGFTGDDIRIACKEATLAAIRCQIACKS